MPITKHIQNLAQGIANERIKDFKKKGIYSATDEQYKEDNINYYQNELTRLKNALINVTRERTIKKECQTIILYKMKTQLLEFIIMHSTFKIKELQSKNVYELKALAKFIYPEGYNKLTKSSIGNFIFFI